jgi:peptide/nickel transport system permease protein
MKDVLRSLRELIQYPSAVVGLVLVAALIGVSIYTVIALPYNQAIALWRAGENTWYRNPKFAQPAWTNLFRSQKLADTIDLSTVTHASLKTVKTNPNGSSVIEINIPFDYSYDSFPSELTIFFTSTYASKAPFVSVALKTPDNRTIRMKNFSITTSQDYRISQDNNLKTKLGGARPEVGLFSVPKSKPEKVLKGQYILQIEGATFEKNSDINAEFVSYGQVYGLAGTDNLRRDLMVALLWGTPVALAFGLLAAVGTSLLQMVIAAAGTWFGGWVDQIIQRVTEINLVLPFLPILIMIGTFYSRSLWIILSAVVVLSVFGTGIKTYRAIFLQTKEAPYIEAARAYGANNSQIIFSYLIPRIIPLLIPQFIVLIPSYVFLEASLAVLGLGDPTLPTWGKIIDDARANGALFQGWYYWVLEPSMLLMVTGLAFSMLGFALDRIFNPRLRGQ